MDTGAKSRKIRRLKGSVLFTTLVVMILILLIMLAAIGLAGAASKRAYSTWYDNQTKYTAQDLVDNVIETLGPTGTHPDLGKNIVGKLKNKGDKVTVDVKVNSSNYIPGYGEVQPITFEYVADNGSDFNISGLGSSAADKIIKVSTSVTMGGETSTYSTYAVGDKKSVTTEGNSGGFVSFGGYDIMSQPRTVGRVYLGVEDRIDKMEAAANEPLLAGDIFFNCENCNLRMQGADGKIILGRNDPTHGYYGGIRIAGNYYPVAGVGVESQYPSSYITDMSGENFYNIPYFYVDKKLTLESGDGFRVKGNGMLNLYCNELACSNYSKIDGNVNVMIMGETSNNILKLGASSLTDWAASTFSGKPSDSSGKFETGNFYCKGDLSIESTGDNNFSINGDLCVVGDLNLTQKITINNGDVYVGGNITNSDKIVGAGKVHKLTGVTNSSSFVSQLRALDTTEHPNASAIADRFVTAFTLDDGADTQYIQTLDNIKKQFIDESTGTKVYKGVVETSANTSTNIWDGVSDITSSCIMDSSKNYNTGIERTININPGGNEIWIDIDGVTDIGMYKFIIDDTNPSGSVNFFIKKTGATQSLNFTKVKIYTKTYNDLLGGNKELNLSTFPGYPYVPHVKICASSDTNVTISCGSECAFTCDVVAPKATFKCESDSGVKNHIKYTYFNYVDMDGNGTVESTEQANKITVDRSDMEVGLIGSLQVDKIAVNNEFGYIYVDDPPSDTGDPGSTDVFNWTTIDGYSTY